MQMEKYTIFKGKLHTNSIDNRKVTKMLKLFIISILI